MGEEKEKMQQLRRLFRVLSSVSLLRLLLVSAIVTIFLAAILSCCIFPSGKVAVRHASLTNNEIAIKRLSYGLHWTRVYSPRQFLKVAAPLQKLDRINGMVILNKLWKLPSVRNFVQCIQPSKSYTAPNGSKGYLLVNTNGGLNQMRAGREEGIRIPGEPVAVSHLLRQPLLPHHFSSINGGIPEFHVVGEDLDDVAGRQQKT